MSVTIQDDFNKLTNLLCPGGEAAALRIFGPIGNVNDTDGVVAGTGVTISNEDVGQVHQTVITLTNLAVTTTDATTDGAYGSQKIYDLPAGAMLTLGARTKLTITAAAGISASGTVKHALGTVAVSASDALTSTLANILPSTNTTLSSSAGTGLGVSTAVCFADGTVTLVDVILNFGIADASTTTNSTLTVSGTITLTWINLGTL